VPSRSSEWSSNHVSIYLEWQIASSIFIKDEVEERALSFGKLNSDNSNKSDKPFSFWGGEMEMSIEKEG
jgi:hypothetical protein